MARPTDYNEEILAKAISYVDNYDTEGLDHAIPSVAGLARYLGVARSTIYDWASQEEKKAFSDILQTLLAEQENTLINKGLTSKFNSTITKLILTKHGYSDKMETDITSKGDSISRTLKPEEAQMFDKWAEDAKKLEGLD
jgi:hypothetical protein